MPHALRLTPPQQTVLRLLREGWSCTTAGIVPPAFHKLLAYRFAQGTATRWVSGTTLASLLRRQYIAWDATELTLALDGRRYPGFQLVLTGDAPQERLTL